MIKDCYGDISPENPECSGCEIRRYCREAGLKPSRYEIPVEQTMLDKLLEERGEKEGTNRLKHKRFSYEDVLQVLTFLVQIPQSVLRALRCLLTDAPASGEFKLSKLADKLHISRQAVWLIIHRDAEKYPELKKVFIYRRKRK